MINKEKRALIITFISKEDWYKMIPQFLDYNYRQSWDYSVALSKHWQAESEHVAIYAENVVLSLTEIRIKKIPLLNIGIAYISGGPLVRRGTADDINNLQIAVELLIEEYVKKRGFILRILCPIGTNDWTQQVYDIFTSSGFSIRNDLVGYRTIVLNLEPAVEKIRANLAQKWRNCLNASQRADIKIYTSTGSEIYSKFCDLYAPFLLRKKLDFELDAHFYADFQDNAPELDRLIVSIAEKDGQVIAGHVSSMLGDTCVYLHGATNERALEVKAGYALQWHTINEAKNRGFHYYDLGGIDPVNNPGLYHFKSNMGGYEINAAGPFEITPKNLICLFLIIFEILFRNLRYTQRKINAKIRLYRYKH